MFSIERLIGFIYEPIVDYLEKCRSLISLQYECQHTYCAEMTNLWHAAFIALQKTRFFLPKELFNSLERFECDYLIQISHYIAVAMCLGSYGGKERFDTEDCYDLYVERVIEQQIDEKLYEPLVSINTDSVYGILFEDAVREEAITSRHYDSLWTIGEVVIDTAYECLEQLLGGYRECA